MAIKGQARKKANIWKTQMFSYQITVKMIGTLTGTQIVIMRDIR